MPKYTVDKGFPDINGAVGRRARATGNNMLPLRPYTKKRA